jgi:hypothetical protein
MPYSALALGHESLRLRSRRVRSDRSHRLSVRFALGLLVLASLAGFVGATWQTRSSSAADMATIDQQRYATIMWNVRAQVDESAVRMGLMAAQYVQGDIDAHQLKDGLDDDLTNFRRVDEQLRDLRPAGELRVEHQDYLDAVRLFEQSALEMMKVTDDGDSTHVSAAIPASLEGVSRLRRAISD